MAQLRDLLVSGASRFLNGMNINGDIAIGGNILPATTKTYDIGSSSLLWNYIYSDYGKFVDGLGVGISPVTNYAFAVSGKSYFEGDLEPSVTDTYSLGKSGTVFKDGYINNLYGLTLTYNAATINGTLAADDATLGDLLVTGATSLVGPVTFGAAEANRIVWTDANKDLIAANHYADATHIGINTTTYNDLKSYNFYVNGTSCFVPSTTNSASAWGVSIRNGLLAITNFGNTLTIGAQNSSWAHFISDQDFYFSNDIQVNGTVKPYVDSSVLTGTRDLGDSTHRWKALYVGTADSYGDTGQPVFWNTGVPQAIDWHIGNSGIGEHNANNITYNMIGYYTSNGPLNLGELSTDGAIYTQAYNSSWVGQIAQDYRNGNLFVRGKNNNTWKPWKAIATADNDFYLSNTITYDPTTRKFISSKTDNDWNAQVYSNYGFKDACSVTFKIGQTTAYIMVGLTSDPEANASYSSIDYCWYPQSGGGLCMYENGTSVSSITGHQSYAVGDEFTIEYANGFIRYYHNGVLCRSVARDVSDPLYFDSSFYNAGNIYAVSFDHLKSQILSTTDNAIARFDLTTGALQNSKVTIDDTGMITIGERISSSSYGEIKRLCIIPYFHTGGPWYISSLDDSSNAHLQLLYGSTPIYKIRHEGTISIYNNVLPSTNNSYTLGTSDLHWKALYIGSDNTYGSTTVPIYWNAGVPTAITSYSGNAATSTKWASTIALKIGASSQNLDGSTSLTYTPYGMRLVRALYNTDTNLNSFAQRGHALGMCNLSDNGSVDNPGGLTSWHHVINLTWEDTSDNNSNTTNEWCTQIANKCGSSDLYVRSRSGGTISNGTAWAAPWTKILTANNYNSYAPKLDGTGATGTWGISISGNADTLDGYHFSDLENRYVNVSGDTMTGALYTPSVASSNACYVAFPNGARYDTTASSITGAFKITLPTYAACTMMRFYVDIYNYNGEGAITYLISGYPYTDASWYNYTAQAIGTSSTTTHSNLAVRFGNDGSKNCIWIGETSTTWSYPHVQVRDFMGGHSTTASSSWASGWSITVVTAFDTVTQTISTANELTMTKVRGAVWNDYAEYRNTLHQIQAGRCVCECGDGSLKISSQRLLPGANIVSDTFGFAIGETDKSKTPLAVSGRVLAYPNEDRYSYAPGDPVCSGPNGTISKMTRDEVMKYPERIVGTVSEIPEYFTWGTGNVKVDGRIWIKIR